MSGSFLILGHSGSLFARVREYEIVEQYFDIRYWFRIVNNASDHVLLGTYEATVLDCAGKVGPLERNDLKSRLIFYYLY
jgi:hypothetical protein